MPGVMAIGRPHVALVARPGVHLDFGEAAADAAVHALPMAAGMACIGRHLMAPLLAFASSAKVIFFLASSVEEITPSADLQLRDIHLERVGRALEQFLAQLVRGIAKRSAL